MIDSKYFEIPDFCTLTRDCEPDCPCNGCLKVFNDCGAKLGVKTPPVSKDAVCGCHDICVEEVVLIADSGEFTKCIAYPPVGPCRIKCTDRNFQFPQLTIGDPAQVILWCADEQIDDGCQSITVSIGLVVIVGNCDLTHNPIVLPLPNFTKTFTGTQFRRFPDCSTLTAQDFKNELTRIDGSCIVAQFNAKVTSANQITITGKIIDKLWRSENLWVEGIRPYELNDAAVANGYSSYTVKGFFNSSHGIGPCTDLCAPSPL